MELTDTQKYVLYKIVSGVKEGKTQQTLGGYAGTGKAQPLTSLVYTPSGPKKMGDLIVGENVCTPDGGQALITGVFPQGEKIIYRFHFDDGTWADSCIDHLWSVVDRTKLSNLKKHKTGNRVYPTSYIVSKIDKVDGNRRFYIPTAICEFEESDVLINPYLLGVMLGDGSIGNNNFGITSEDDEILENVKQLLVSWECCLSRTKKDLFHRIVGKHRRGSCSTSTPLRMAFRELGLWDTVSQNKFIPKCYLSNSISVRSQILCGLMDTDGTVDSRTGMASITTVSYQLAQDIVVLVNSIGGKATIVCKKKHCYYKGEKKEVDAFEVNVRHNKTTSLFSLKRKQLLSKDRIKYKVQRAIRSITFLGKEECKCISIDSKEHLYVTDNFIPTHNTTVAKYITNFFPKYGVCAYTGKAANVLRRKGIDASTIHSLIYTPYITPDGKLVGFQLAAKEKLNCEGFIIDEASMVSKDIYRDLCYYGMPMICIGDHGQLEPIGSDFNLMKSPDYTLEEIHRNAGPIAKFAESLRFGKPARRFEECEEVWFRPQRRLSDDHLLEVDQIICAYNKTRVETNSRIRSALGHTGLLNEGERVMCLKNNKGLGIFNGMQGVVRGLYECPQTGRKMMSFEADNEIREIWYDTRQFGTEKPVMDYIGKEYPNPFDYAYCITCHKSQADEWDKVMVIEQRCKNWDHCRWAYTAASRAKEKLVWAY